MTELLRPRDVEAFIAAVEDLLERRRKQMLKQTPKRRYREVRRASENPTRFTLEELYAFYPPFREIRKQRERGYKRPPPRKDIVDLAEIYQCELDELNVLLAAAGYAPEVLYLKGEELLYALDQTEVLINYLPLPGYVITRDWNIHRMNSGGSRLFNLSTEMLSLLPEVERNVLRFIFDTSNPVYSIINHNTEWWEYTAWLNIYWFKLENILSQYDVWYKELVDYLWQFPRFSEFWDLAQPGTKYKEEIAPPPFPAYETEINTPLGDRLRVRGLHTFYVVTGYPRAVLYVPAGEESRMMFTKYGFGTPDNWWGYKT